MRWDKSIIAAAFFRDAGHIWIDDQHCFLPFENSEPNFRKGRIQLFGARRE